MRYKNIQLLLFAAILFAACNSSSSEKNTDTANPVNLPAPTDSGSQSINNPIKVEPNTTTATQPVTTTGQPVIPVTTTGSGLNPEHGKPGHRCDIAVGAPLNSAPTTPTVATTPAVDVQKSLTPAATNISTTKAGLNPEHGKPGHRCDIAVGAPLDSKPSTTSANTTPAINTPVTPTIAQPVTPVLPTGTNTTPGTATTGLNPEHGKPGHRCDIAVGAPLNSKPVDIKKENN